MSIFSSVEVWRGLALSLAILLFVPATASADVLDQIQSNHTIRFAVRDDAPPFSSKGSDGQPTGYSVALCQVVADDLKQQLKLTELAVEFVTVTAGNRFDAIKEGKADILCEATTATLSRREIVDFSIPTFVSGAGLVIRPGGPQDMPGLAGQKVGVLAGTTTEESLKASLQQQNITAETVPASSHDEGIAALEHGDTDAYFADRTILRYILNARSSPVQLLLADNYLTIEPYALAIPHGEDRLRLAVDRALSRLYRSGAVIKLFRESFGDNVKPTALQKGLYTISGLPE